MFTSSLFRSFAGAAALLVVAAVPAQAAVDFSGVFGSLAAKVSFEVAPGERLVVTLTNTSTGTSNVPADVLTGVFFSGLGGISASGGSAILAPGSSVINTAVNSAPYTNLQPPGGNVGGEWAYLGGLSGAPGGATQGISSSGLGLFGGANLNGPNLQNPGALDGMQYGIVTGTTTLANFNPGMTGHAFIRNSVVFTLTNYTGGTAGLAGITNVSFQYGTALNEPNVPGTQMVCANGAPNYPICSPQVVDVPEPMSTAVLGVGLAALGFLRRRRR